MVERRTLGLIAIVPALGCGSPSEGGAEKTGWTSEPVVVCAGGSVVQGVDVSEYQGTVDWTQVHASGRGFAITRVSDGTGHPDPTFATNWSGIKSAGMVRGVYQFFRASEDPNAQANLLVKAVGTLASDDLAPVADVEVSDGVSASQLVNNLATWISAIKNATGRAPMIYAAPGFWNGLPNTAQFSNVVLWVANWQVNCPDTPTPWGGWSFWQYTDSGSVPGISGNVDLDEYNGTLAQVGKAAATPDWAAKYVSQSFPLATMALPMKADQTIASYIELKNVGSKTWDSNTHLGTTQPRDRTSVFADSTWLSPNRPAGVSGTVPPGGTYQFQFNLHAPNQAGTYDEYFGVVEEGVAWFSDPGQGGPPDNDLEAQVNVLGGSLVDGGMAQSASDGGAGSAPSKAADGASPDSGPSQSANSDGGPAVSSGAPGGADGGGLVGAVADGGPPPGIDGGSSRSAGTTGGHSTGCGCAVPAGPHTPPWMVAGGVLVGLLFLRRRPDRCHGNDRGKSGGERQKLG